MVLQDIFENKGILIIRHNLEIYDQPDRIETLKSRGLKWVGHLARMEEDCSDFIVAMNRSGEKDL